MNVDEFDLFLIVNQNVNKKVNFNGFIVIAYADSLKM